MREVKSTVLALVLLLVSAASAAAQELPILFVHGFCSSADTWNDTLPLLSTRRYGTESPRLYEDANGAVAARTPVPSSGAKMFRIDFSDLKGGFDLLAVANVPTSRKAGELKVVIDGIKRFTGAPGVIVIGHSLGGLATRSYMQGTGTDRTGASIPYGKDIAALIMIDTPNQGSLLASLSGFPEANACTLADTQNLRDLKPTSPFLLELNRRPWPSPAAVHSIISYNTGRDSDDVVTTESQDLTEIDRYEFLKNQGRWRQSFTRKGILHLRVHNEATTVSLFSAIVDGVDFALSQAGVRH